MWFFSFSPSNCSIEVDSACFRRISNKGKKAADKGDHLPHINLSSKADFAYNLVKKKKNTE